MNNNAPFEGTFGSNFSFEKTYFQLMDGLEQNIM